MTQPQTDSIQRSSWVPKFSTQSAIATFALCLAPLALSSGSIFMTIAAEEMTANQVALSRVAIAALVFSLWNGIRAIAPASETVLGQIGWREVGLLIAAGSSTAAFLVLLAWALAHTQVANATLLTHMMPLFTTLGGWLFLGQRFSAQFWIGLVVALTGAIVLGSGDLRLADEVIWGDIAALGAAVIIAIEMLIVEQLRTRLATTIITMSECAIAALLILPTVLWSGSSILPPSWSSGLAVIAAAVVTQVIGHGLLTYSLKQFSAGLTSVVLLAAPVIAALLAIVCFGQTIQMWSAIAFLIVLVGIYYAVTAPTVEQAIQIGDDQPSDSVG